MSVSNGTISAPVTTTDVCNTLQVSAHKVGYLCSNQHGRTNPFSKHKPVILPVNSTTPGTRFTDIYGRAWNTETDWFRGTSGSFGFSVPTDANAQNPDTNAWTYLPPTGGSSAPYRLGDFRGYKHTANRELLTISPPVQYVAGNPITTRIHINNLDSTTDLSIADVLGIDSSTYGGFRVDYTCGTVQGSKQIDWHGETSDVVLQADSIDSARPGQFVRLTFTGINGLGRVASLNYDGSVSTVIDIPVASTDKYTVIIQCQVVLRYMNNQGYIEVHNAKCIINAVNYTGGDIEGGYFGVWREEYEANMDYSSASSKVDIPVTHIDSGDTLEYALDPIVTIYSPVEETKVIFQTVINNAVVAKLEQPIRRMNS